MSVSGRMKRAKNCIGIVIDNNEEFFTGRVFNRYQKEPVAFGDLPELLDIVEGISNQLNYPAEKIRKRYFKHASKEDMDLNLDLDADLIDVEEMLGGENGFILMVTGRDNATIQGSVYDTKEKEEVSFDGDVELIRIINK